MGTGQSSSQWRTAMNGKAGRVTHRNINNWKSSSHELLHSEDEAKDRLEIRYCRLSFRRRGAEWAWRGTEIYCALCSSWAIQDPSSAAAAAAAGDEMTEWSWAVRFCLFVVCGAACTQRELQGARRIIKTINCLLPGLVVGSRGGMNE